MFSILHFFGIKCEWCESCEQNLASIICNQIENPIKIAKVIAEKRMGRPPHHGELPIMGRPAGERVSLITDLFI